MLGRRRRNRQNMKEIKTGRRCVAAANSLRSYQDDSFGCCSIFVKPHMSALICLLINGSVSLHTHPFVFNEARLSLFTGSRFSTSLDKSSFVYKKRMNAFGRTVFGFLIEIHIENRPKYGIGLVYLILPLSHYRSVISWLNQLSF